MSKQPIQHNRSFRAEAAPVWPPTEEVSKSENLVLFEVTVKAVIGQVMAIPGPHTARQSAFLIIADHGMPGEFSFPTEDGGIETVIVTQSPADESSWPPWSGGQESQGAVGLVP